jgi:hypothetical protein
MQADILVVALLTIVFFTPVSLARLAAIRFEMDACMLHLLSASDSLDLCAEAAGAAAGVVSILDILLVGGSFLGCQFPFFLLLRLLAGSFVRRN